MSVDKNRSSFLMSFLDMVFAMLLAVCCLLLLTYILIITVKEETKKVETKAEILITMTWDDKSANDIDMWVLSPERMKIGYGNKQNSYMGLERDDLGLSNDMIATDPGAVSGEQQLIYKNIETVAIRTLRPGRYIVNVNWYSAKPNPVTGETKVINEEIEVQLIRVNPSYNVSAVSKIVLPAQRAEKTAFSFDITEDGKIENISYEDQPFIYANINHGVNAL